MVNDIIACRRCPLHLNQEPLLDKPIKNAIMMVGLSAKLTKSATEIPLDNTTKSGQLVRSMEEIAEQYGLQVYRSNLVKCPPLDNQKKIRYPSNKEINICFANTLYEFDTLSPQIVMLFGDIVQNAFRRNLNLDIKNTKGCTFSVLEKNNRLYVASYHPSYVMRSTLRKQQYLENFSKLLQNIIVEGAQVNDKCNI